MTGFGSSSKDVPGGTITCEIRSLNHRFLSLRQNLPDGLAELEPAVDQLIRAKIRRGSISVVVSAVGTTKSCAPTLDTERFKGLVKQVRRLKKQLGSRDPVDIEALLGLPGVWNSNNAVPWKPSVEAAKGAVTAALSKVLKAREREGRAARRAIGKNVEELGRISKELLKRTPLVQKAYRERIQARLEAIVPASTEQEPLYKEIASMLDKCDISEETERLAHHVSEVRKAMRAKGPVGRRLDFLCQEMLREINTTASKAALTPVIDLTIQAKAVLERIKEQVENIE
jgi:uncharacterized protein (TIGR00255 family)